MASTTPSPAPENREPALLGSAVPVVLVPGLGERIGFRPAELARMLGVSRDLVNSWVDRGEAPLADFPGDVRIIPAWWVAERAGGPGRAPAQGAGPIRWRERETAPRRPASVPSPSPAEPPRLRVVPSPAPSGRGERRWSAKKKTATPAAWSVPPTVGR